MNDFRSEQVETTSLNVQHEAYQIFRVTIDKIYLSDIYDEKDMDKLDTMFPMTKDDDNYQVIDSTICCFDSNVLQNPSELFQQTNLIVTQEVTSLMQRVTDCFTFIQERCKTVVSDVGNYLNCNTSKIKISNNYDTSGMEAFHKPIVLNDATNLQNTTCRKIDVVRTKLKMD